MSDKSINDKLKQSIKQSKELLEIYELLDRDFMHLIATMIELSERKDINVYQIQNTLKVIISTVATDKCIADARVLLFDTEHNEESKI